MKKSKEYLLNIFKNDIKVKEKLEKIKGENVYLEIKSEEKHKSIRQNNTFQSLARAFFNTGCSSYDNLIDLKSFYKKESGIGFEYYQYYTGTDFAELCDGKIVAIKKTYNLEDVYINGKIQEGIYCFHGVLKSFRTATKKQAKNAIDLLLSHIFSSGASPDKNIQKILTGMEKNNQ